MGNLKTLFGGLLALTLTAAVATAGEVPATAKERGFFLLPEFHAYAPDEATRMEEFLKIVQSPGVPVSVKVDKPIKIAMMFPSLETSDAWARLNIALVKRLEEVKVPFEVTELMIRPDEHGRQATQIEQVLAQDFDYVVIGPSEYQAQKANLERLAQKIPTLVMNVVNPFVDLVGTDKMPLTHVGFDHSVGAKVLCEWIIKEKGGEGTFALMRYLPGLVDDQRSNVFRDCVLKNSNMKFVTEYEAHGDREKAFTGANAVLSKHPDVTMLHSASTAVALGALAAAEERGVIDKVIVNGWGGGGDELKSIIAGKLKVTAFRVNDDWGVSVAEAIKAHVEGKKVPLVIAATIKAVDYRMNAEQIKAETDYAFRYSGVLDR
ncbi:MAG: substrate-binding domain-containing protein [Rhodospirillales bacterium]|nr:substrate-binding domain-containing protein [Rhodospirillales bacterium]